MGITAYTIKSLIGRITDKKYLTGINKEVKVTCFTGCKREICPT
jgi:hypothetical protein